MGLVTMVTIVTGLLGGHSHKAKNLLDQLMARMQMMDSSEITVECPLQLIIFSEQKDEMWAIVHHQLHPQLERSASLRTPEKVTWYLI